MHLYVYIILVTVSRACARTFYGVYCGLDKDDSQDDSHQKWYNQIQIEYVFFMLDVLDTQCPTLFSDSALGPHVSDRRTFILEF